MKKEAIIKVIHIGKSFIEDGKGFQVIKDFDFDLFENGLSPLLSLLAPEKAPC